MIPMASRFGECLPPPSPERADRTRIYVAQLMLKRPKVEFEWMGDGNIRFGLPLDDTAMPPSVLRNAKLLRTQWFANSVGEFLVRTNFDSLDDFVRQENFPELASQRWYTGFGMWITPHGLQFQFHCEVLNRLFNERLRWELRGIHP